jgi:hypothetical protein
VTVTYDVLRKTFCVCVVDISHTTRAAQMDSEQRQAMTDLEQLEHSLRLVNGNGIWKPEAPPTESIGPSPTTVTARSVDEMPEVGAQNLEGDWSALCRRRRRRHSPLGSASSHASDDCEVYMPRRRAAATHRLMRASPCRDGRAGHKDAALHSPRARRAGSADSALLRGRTPRR